MPQVLGCPHCSSLVSIADDLASHDSQCPSCRLTLSSPPNTVPWQFARDSTRGGVPLILLHSHGTSRCPRGPEGHPCQVDDDLGRRELHFGVRPARRGVLPRPNLSSGNSQRSRMPCWKRLTWLFVFS
jgi:hypothetical protein